MIRKAINFNVVGKKPYKKANSDLKQGRYWIIKSEMLWIKVNNPGLYERIRDRNHEYYVKEKVVKFEEDNSDIPEKNKRELKAYKNKINRLIGGL